VGHAAQVLHEVEADAADTAGVQVLEVLVREARVDVRDAAVLAAALRDRIEDHRVVGAVAARVDEHGALEAERLLQLFETLERRVRRRVRAIRCVRILVTRPEDVTVRVAGLRRRLVARRPRVRIRRHAYGYLSHSGTARAGRAPPWPA